MMTFGTNTINGDHHWFEYITVVEIKKFDRYATGCCGK